MKERIFVCWKRSKNPERKLKLDFKNLFAKSKKTKVGG